MALRYGRPAGLHEARRILLARLGPGRRHHPVARCPSSSANSCRHLEVVVFGEVSLVTLLHLGLLIYYVGNNLCLRVRG